MVLAFGVVTDLDRRNHAEVKKICKISSLKNLSTTHHKWQHEEAEGAEVAVAAAVAPPSSAA